MDKQIIENNKEKKRIGIIKRRVIAGIIVFTLLTNLSMCLSGSFIFNHAIQKIYNERGYILGRIILNHIDNDKVAEYASTWQEDDYYYEMSDYLSSIQEASNAAYIYICVPYEDKTIKYIYDTDSDMGFVDPVSAPFDEIWRCYKEGVKPESYLVRHSQYGHLTSSCLPVRDSSGNVVALLFVDTNMAVIQEVLGRFIINMIIISLIVLLVLCILNWRYFDFNLVKPYNSVAAEKERISAELNVATKIQADMLPRKFPPFPERMEFDIYATMTPAKEVGGDFYDFFFIDDDHLALVIADVSDKGVPAALFMVIAKTLIKNMASIVHNYSPAKILTEVNNQLCEGNDAYLFVTVWLGIIEISTGKLTTSNAGHEHPVIKRNNGEFQLDIYKHSPALATMEGIRFKEQETVLNPGDCIFVYTDGVTEATNSKQELFGKERLVEALNKNNRAEAKELLENVKKDIDAFVDGSPQFDDITMLGFIYKGM